MLRATACAANVPGELHILATEVAGNHSVRERSSVHLTDPDLALGAWEQARSCPHHVGQQLRNGGLMHLHEAGPTPV